MEIVSIANIKIKELKKQKAKNHFLLFLDTPKLIKEALDNNYVLTNLLVQKQKQFDLLTDDFVKQNQSKIIYVEEKIIKQFSNVEQNAGIIGVFETKKQDKQICQTNILILDFLQDPGNVGTLLRSALAADFKKVVLIDSVNISNEKVIRSSAGAIFKLDIEETSIDEFVLNYKDRFKDYQLFYADMNGKNIFEQNSFPKKVAIVLGNEGNGVRKQIKDIANGTFSLPMKNGLESLNVAVSGSMIMYLISFGG